MIVLKFTLAVCGFAGCWQPASWTSLSKSIMYRAYAIFLISSLNIFLISQLVHVALNVGNSDEFTDALYMMLTILVAGYKQIYMWVDRKSFVTIINVLTERPFAPCESRELMIQRKFERAARANTLRYLILVLTSISSIILMSVFTELTRHNLTYKAWIPFNYSPPIVFSLVYTHQLIAMSTSGIVNVACDSLLCGFLLYICCQLEILGYRLSKITRDQDILHECVYHHNRIFEYAYVVNNKFAIIIAMQFAVSMLVVCSNLYRMAMAANYMNYIPLMVYTSAILMQIFIYCWFGNEIKLKSLHLIHNVYDIEWTTLSVSSKKALLFIMKRAMAPIKFHSSYIIIMSLESFVALIKMSYSIFNLLLRTQEQS